MPYERLSGILLHPTSLPGPFGAGDLGPEAYRFVDFLARTGQGLWQILPLGPTGFADSPYMCFSAFGGNPLLVSLEHLVEEGLLDAGDVAGPPGFPAERVDYGRVHAFKRPLLDRAAAAFHERYMNVGYPSEYYEFCEQNAFWLEDYALFMALKEAHGGRMWSEWEPGAAHRDPEALVQWRNRLQAPILARKFLQFTFFRQWTALRRYTNERGIRIIGDLPIYVAYDSAEVWANRSQFFLDDAGRPVVVAGVPPDYFSATGQRWGNPIYRWDRMEAEGFHWWVDRFRVNFALADVVRLDHFRGFEAYWEVPAADETAIEGRWVKAPGHAFLAAVRDQLASLGLGFDVIAEDLGVITPEVDALRDHFGLPGMRILQMAFGSDPKASEYRPHHHVRDAAVYTATHDHNTTVGWFTAAPGSQTTQSPEEVERERREALAYLGRRGEAIHWDFIRAALGSVAAIAVFPMQDLLGLGAGSRMNLPGTARGNWEWRLAPDRVTPAIERRLSDLTATYERNRGVTPAPESRAPA